MRPGFLVTRPIYSITLKMQQMFKVLFFKLMVIFMYITYATEKGFQRPTIWYQTFDTWFGSFSKMVLFYTNLLKKATYMQAL